MILRSYGTPMYIEFDSIFVILEQRPPSDQHWALVFLFNSLVFMDGPHVYNPAIIRKHKTIPHFSIPYLI